MNILFMGLGRIGLPQSLVFASSGHTVYGYDRDLTHVELLKNKIIPFYEPNMEDLLLENIGSNFHPIEKYEKYLDVIDAVIFTLGTNAPDSESCLGIEKGDISNIIEIIDNIFNLRYKKGILIVFRTTLFLGSTDKIRNYIINKFKLVDGIDFNIVFVPERLMEGAAINEEKKLPKIIGGSTNTGKKIASELFKTIGGKIIEVTDCVTAEFCKLTDNSYRNTIFAFSNELAMYAGHLNIDASEVINTINDEYDRNKIPKPGFVSGYCLGKDPYIFEYEFNDFKVQNDRKYQSLWYYGRMVNDFLIDYCLSKAEAELNKVGKQIQNTKVALLGGSFKEDIDDFRMSHSLVMVDKLISKGISEIRMFDPKINQNKYTKLKNFTNCENLTPYSYLDNSFFEGVDVIFVLHRHKELLIDKVEDFENLLSGVNSPAVIFDGWNIWRKCEKLKNVNYISLGYNGVKL